MASRDVSARLAWRGQREAKVIGIDRKARRKDPTFQSAQSMAVLVFPNRNHHPHYHRTCWSLCLYLCQLRAKVDRAAAEMQLKLAELPARYHYLSWPALVAVCLCVCVFPPACLPACLPVGLQANQFDNCKKWEQIPLLLSFGRLN